MSYRLIYGNKLTKLDHGDSMHVDHGLGLIFFFRSNGERLEFLDTGSNIERRDDRLVVVGDLNMSKAANLAELIAATHGFTFEVIKSDANLSVYRFIDPKIALH